MQGTKALKKENSAISTKNFNLLLKNDEDAVIIVSMTISHLGDESVL